MAIEFLTLDLVFKALMEKHTSQYLTQLRYSYVVAVCKLHTRQKKDVYKAPFVILLHSFKNMLAGHYGAHL